MSDMHDMKNALLKTLTEVERFIQREMHSERMTKTATDAAAKYEALDAQIKTSQQNLNALTAEKEALLSGARKQAGDIIKEAEAKRQEAELALVDARKADQKAKDALAEAEKTRLVHETILNDVTAQKDKLRAVLAP